MQGSSCRQKVHPCLNSQTRNLDLGADVCAVTAIRSSEQLSVVVEARVEMMEDVIEVFDTSADNAEPSRVSLASWLHEKNRRPAVLGTE